MYNICMCVYIYIYREREIVMCIYIYIIEREMYAFWWPAKESGQREAKRPRR